MPISDLRKEYHHEALDKKTMLSSPIAQFEIWFNEAIEAKFLEPNAMVLATASDKGTPSARVVLLKNFEERGFFFYTNYLSQKGRELETNPQAAAVFYWDKLERQVRISGEVLKLSSEESKSYFSTRPRDSQLAAAISEQSQIIENRTRLEQKYARAMQDLGDSEIEMPTHWGGYCLQPRRVEFWQGRPNRMHDRIVYSRVSDDWKVERLQP